MKKAVTRFIGFIAIVAIVITGLSVTSFADGNGMIPDKEWSEKGYNTTVLNKLYEDQKIDYIISGINSKWSDIQKVAYVYSHIYNNYRHDDTSSVMYCTQSGKGVCVSYARLAHQIFRKIGINSYAVSMNYAYTELGHSVVLVEIDDKWYELDCNAGKFCRGRFSKGYQGPINPVTNKRENAEEYYGIAVEKSSEYELYNYSFFEYNGQWYAYNESELHKMKPSLETKDEWTTLFYLDANKSASEMTVKEHFYAKANGNVWKSSSFAYDGNGKLYYDYYGDIYAYNVATNKSNKVISIGNNIKGAAYTSGELQIITDRTSQNAPIAWLGVDKYALYYVTRDNKFGTITLSGSENNLELEKASITMKAGDAAFNTAVTSTEYLCGYQLSYTSSNPKVADVDRYGMIYAKKKGTAYITVSYMGRSTKYKVSVKSNSYTGKVDSIPYVYYNPTGAMGGDLAVNAYDSILKTNKLPKSVAAYNIIGNVCKLERGVSLNLKYLANLNKNTSVDNWDPNSVTLKKSGNEYIVTADINYARLNVTNKKGTDRIVIDVSPYKSKCTYFKVKYSSKTPATSLKVGSTFKVTNNTDLRCEQTEIDVSSVTWVTTNDNIQLISNETHQVNSSLEFKAVKKGKTTIYCISSTGVVKEITVTIK